MYRFDLKIYDKNTKKEIFSFYHLFIDSTKKEDNK